MKANSRIIDVLQITGKEVDVGSTAVINIFENDSYNHRTSSLNIHKSF